MCTSLHLYFCKAPVQYYVTRWTFQFCSETVETNFAIKVKVTNYINCEYIIPGEEIIRWQRYPCNTRGFRRATMPEIRDRESSDGGGRIAGATMGWAWSTITLTLRKEHSEHLHRAHYIWALSTSKMKNDANETDQYLYLTLHQHYLPSIKPWSMYVYDSKSSPVDHDQPPTYVGIHIHSKMDQG